MTVYLKKRVFPLILLLLFINVVSSTAQQFTAMEGSIYGGALNTAVQPASAANLPYRWDVEIAGANFFWNNNIVTTSPLYWNTTSDTFQLSGHFLTGPGKRWGDVHAETHLLNFLLRLPWAEDSWLGQKKVVAGAGWNFHGHAFFDRLSYNYEDTMKTMGSFLKVNAFNKINSGRSVNQQWMEWYATAAAVLKDDATSRFTAGITLKLVKGIAAEVIDLQGVSVGVNKASMGSSKLVFNYAHVRYGYSANLEDLQNSNSFKETSKTLASGSPFSPAIDLGISYTRKQSPGYIAGMTGDDLYDWKVEVALTGLGRLKYPLGNQSRIISSPKNNADVARFSKMTQTISSLNDLNDSLQNITEIQMWQDEVSISLPTALRINMDKYLGKNFYLNARAVLDASFLNFSSDYKMHQLSYLMLTPRWEIKRLGVYAPVYVNAHGGAMVGAALRLGPLVIGIHDFGWLFHNTPTGGAYLALVIRSLPKKASYCPLF